MAANRRDIEMLISARETTGRSFKQVTDNIDALNTKIGEQIAQAERGEISLRELRQTQEQLAAAGRDLSALQGQIDAYNKLTATSEKVGAAADKAKANLAELAAVIAGSEKATAAQENKMQRLEVAVVKTSAAVEKNKQDLTEQVAVLERAGIATDKLDQAQAGVVNSARQVGAGLVQVNAAMADYSSNVATAQQRETQSRRDAADEARMTAAEQKQALAAQNLAAQQAATQRIALAQQIQDAEQRLNQQNAFDGKISEAQRLGDASKFVQLFASSIETVSAAENQLSALSGFRAIGQQAAEASRDMSRFVENGQTMAITSQQIASGLRAILDPGGAALQTLKGVEDAIAAADAIAAEGVTNVSLLSNAYNDLSAAAASLLRQGSLVDSFQQQEAATENARQAFDRAKAEVQQLGRAMATADEPTEQLARSLQLAEASLTKAGRALAQEETKLGQVSRELKSAEINTKNLAAEQARLEAAATQVSATMERVNTTLGRGGRATGGLFGLRPHDLANLSYQINDIVVSLASGQNPMMVLVQQGSQIGQIFPGLISTISRFALAWGPVVIAVGGFAAAMYEVYTDAERLKTVMDDLALIPTGAGLDPERFADTQEKLEGVAGSAEAARDALLKLAEEGFDDAQLETYSTAAKNLAERLGIDLAEAAQMVVDIQRGGIDAVYDLTEKTNDLTTADLDHVEALFAAGQADEARLYVLDRVAERNAEIARLTRSEWTPAVDNLKIAWNNFTNWLGSTFENQLTRTMNKIRVAITLLTVMTGLLAGKSVDQTIKDASAPNPKDIARGESDQQLRDRRYAATLDERELQNRKALTSQARLQTVESKARTEAIAAGVSKTLQDRAATQAVALEQRKINEEAERERKKGAAAGRRATAAANRAQRTAETEQRKREAAQRQLEGQLRQLNRAAFSGISASLDERLQAISEKYETIADSIKKVRDLGMTADSEGTDLGVIERQAAAQEKRLRDEEMIKFYQEQAALLDKQRAAENQRIADAQERGAITTKEAMTATAEVASRISPQIVQAAQAALTVARALAGTQPSPEMVSWIASLERIITGEQTNNAVADMGMAGLDKVSGELNKLLRERDDLVQAFEQLNDLGLATAGNTRAAIASAFSTQAEAIRPVLDDLRATVDALHAQIDPLTMLPVLTDTAYATWLAKIQAINAGLTQTTTKLTEMETNTLKGIASAGVSAFETMSQSLVGLIAGTESWGDAFKAIGRSILQSLADITAGIARAIVQFLILRALEAAANLPPGTLSGGGGSTGLFGLFHDGGVVGSRGTSRQRRTAMNDNWAGAPKFHGGGMPGLAPDEYKAILKRGEEVLTEDNPRHINNAGQGGGSSAAPVALKQVLLMDESTVASAMQTRSGEKATLTTIRLNAATVRQMLDM